MGLALVYYEKPTVLGKLYTALYTGLPPTRTKKIIICSNLKIKFPDLSLTLNRDFKISIVR